MEPTTRPPLAELVEALDEMNSKLRATAFQHDRAGVTDLGPSLFDDDDDD
jgi:hypothetical protein